MPGIRLLDLVLGLGRRSRLPLHVAGSIGAAALQWLDVINNEPRACPRNDLLAAGFRAILPLAVRTHVVHFFVEDPARATAERRSDRAADRGALRCAERELRRLVEAHVGDAAIRRHSAMTNLRIIMQHLLALCAGNNRPICGAFVEGPSAGASPKPLVASCVQLVCSLRATGIKQHL